MITKNNYTIGSSLDQIRMEQVITQEFTRYSEEKQFNFIRHDSLAFPQEYYGYGDDHFVSLFTTPGEAVRTDNRPIYFVVFYKDHSEIKKLMDNLQKIIGQSLISTM